MVTENQPAIGALMLDFEGTMLTPEERELLQNPHVGGVILFSRNFESIAQVMKLIADARECCPQTLLIAVDHEGGRVQRFHNGFSAIPAMAAIAQQFGVQQPALTIAKELGWLMASECLATDIDFSFAPVLDRRGISDVIGDRAFSSEAGEIIPLASAFIDGMNEAGMKATGKHYPGHGSVKEDSHIAIPVDKRSAAEIEHDLAVFKAMIHSNHLQAVMPAHVIYPAIDDKPAGFSQVWLDKLRHELQFGGVIFSDDLAMEGANPMGSFAQRADAALEAGCDMVLVCNQRSGVEDVLENAKLTLKSQSISRLACMRKSTQITWDQLKASQRWKSAQTLLKQFE